MGDRSKLRNEITDPGGSDLTPIQKFISRIKGMLIGTEYDYAEMTLRGILATVEDTRYVTEGQRQAIENIEASPRREGSGGRRSQRWYGG